ncbi:hypothetical protein F4776DRAFT_637099 [Hypoxylon sp. NC0597]|nr:hypothetical protein F4776DRAFT_637099 [Hypoxylon sp. NC0597]
MSNASSTGYGLGSPTSTESGTLIPTPSTSRASSIGQPSSTNIPSGPLNLTLLSTTSWRQPYPSVGQFAMAESEVVVAAGPDGLFYFRRVRDHPATPWSESRSFPCVQATLNELTVSGLALYSRRDFTHRSRLYLYCVSGGVLYTFYLLDKNNSSFLPATSPPLAGRKVMGKPAVVQTNVEDMYPSVHRWSLVVPCQSGGLLHTSATDRMSSENSLSTEWGFIDHLALDLGIISAVSVTAVPKTANHSTAELVAVCISRGQLNVVQGPYHHEFYLGRWRWDGKTSTRISHPGEVTGNPMLITGDTRYSDKNQLDLIVPSVEGGVFHFVRSQSAPNDWHMIGRIAFPQNIPPASCLSFHSRSDTYGNRELYGLVQICGRLYHVKTTNKELPWYNARLNPIVQPGPFLEL